MIVEVTPFDHGGGLLVSQLKSSITPQALVSECVKNTAILKTKVCFLTHIGLDLYHLYEYSLLFKDPRSDAPRLRMGEKFVIPLVYVKQEELKIEESGQRLRYYLEIDERVKVFYELLKRSNCEHLIDSSGPYTLFAPDNAMLEKAYGPHGEALRTKTKSLDVVVCSYFVPGIYDRDFTGQLISITGQELQIQNGILQIPKHVTTEVEPRVVAGNGTMVIITSSGVLRSEGRGDFMAPKNLTTNVTISDIAFSTHTLLQSHVNFARKVRSSMRDYIRIMSDKLDELDDLDVDLDSLTDQIGYLNHSRGKVNVVELRALNDIYFEHLKTSSRVAALQISVESLTRDIKNL
jgi:uncharacterized surface protein with fasciclin (FAS1) repeats